MLAYPLSFVGGVLTALSPCVLPALPIIMGSAAQGHRRGPLLVVAGMVSSFTLLGVLVGSLGNLIGFDGDLFRKVSAGLLIVFGGLLWFERSLSWLNKLSEMSSRALSSRESESPLYHLAVGALLGGVWSPCVGPILGSAITLSSHGSVVQSALMMFLFSLGTGLVLFLASTSFAAVMKKNQLWVTRFAVHSKKIFAVCLIGIGIATISGFDKFMEASILRSLPQGWVDLTSTF